MVKCIFLLTQNIKFLKIITITIFLKKICAMTVATVLSLIQTINSHPYKEDRALMSDVLYVFWSRDYAGELESDIGFFLNKEQNWEQLHWSGPRQGRDGTSLHPYVSDKWRELSKKWWDPNEQREPLFWNISILQK